jgi:hypothetical protein
VLCSNCRTELPDNARFCLECGEVVKTPKNDAPAPAAEQIACKKCGTELPAGSRFCLKCGRPVPLPAETPKPATVAFCDCGTKLPALSQFCPMCGKPVNSRAGRSRVSKLLTPKNLFRFALWLLAPAVLLAIWWAASSNSQGARQIQQFVTRAHTETIVPAVFSVKARGFSSYKFSVPSGAFDVAVAGECIATGDNSSELEVYVFKEDAFVNWQSGYASSSYYSSGKVTKADIRAPLPAGVGSYYVVFNNNFSPRVTKAVQADVTLHYNKFWPQF